MLIKLMKDIMAKCGLGGGNFKTIRGYINFNLLFYICHNVIKNIKSILYLI